MHTKPVLFVDDNQTEPPELHVILEKGVGAYHYRGSAARQLIQDSLSSLALGSATQPGNGLLKRRKPGFQIRMVLLCQQFGGRHKGDLIAGSNGV